MKERTMTTTPMTHHHLKAEWLNDKHGPAIVLTQQGDYSESNTALMRPWQLGAMCEHFGLMTAYQQTGNVAILQRRTLALRDRIDALGDYMTQHSDHKHADLSHELNTFNMLAELADEWCADFQDTPTQVSNIAKHRASIFGNSEDAKPATAQAFPTQAPLL
jgi:hypothetical protein